MMMFCAAGDPAGDVGPDVGRSADIVRVPVCLPADPRLSPRGPGQHTHRDHSGDTSVVLW